MTTTMKDLPEELTSAIIKSIKHEPIYKIKLTYISASIHYGDDEPHVQQDVERVEKLIMLTGNEEDAKKEESIGCRFIYFDKIQKNNTIEFPAYLNTHDYVAGTGKVEKIIKATDYLTRGRTWSRHIDNDDKHVIIIEDLERVA